MWYTSSKLRIKKLLHVILVSLLLTDLEQVLLIILVIFLFQTNTYPS